MNTYNAGTAFRHRAKLLPILVALAVVPVGFARSMPATNRLLLAVNDPKTFFPNRSSLAEAARAAGWDVHVVGPSQDGREAVSRAGFTYHTVPLDRRSVGLWNELRCIWTTWRIMRRVRPAVVHAFALKPVLHAGTAARFQRGTRFNGTITGLGYAFTGKSFRVAVLRQFVIGGMGMALGHNRATAIFQNDDDRKVIVNHGIIAAERTLVIRGSGVDTGRYRVTPLPAGAPFFVLPARLLRDKGVVEFIEAARMLRAKNVQARFLLAGDVDPGNPASLSRESVQLAHDSGVIEWLGHQTDMAQIYERCSVVVLPSYREGLPRVLLEGAATGRALIATDVPGCRDVCKDMENGLIVRPQDATDLADAMHMLVMRPALLQKLASRGPAIVQDVFAKQIIEEQQLALYGPPASRTAEERTSKDPEGTSVA